MAARNLGIGDRVLFLGPVFDGAELVEVFARAHCYVCPAALGLSVLHSFGHGVPVVALSEERHGPEATAMACGVNGFLSESCDELGAAIKALVLNHDLSTKMGNAALEHYWNHFTVDHMAQSYLDAIKTLQGPPS